MTGNSGDNWLGPKTEAEMNYLAKVCFVAIFFCLTGCMRQRTEEVLLLHGYAVTKTPIGDDASRSRLTRTVQDRTAVIAEWVSEKGIVLSIMPTPTSAHGQIKSSVFIPYVFDDFNMPVTFELDEKDLKINDRSLDQASFAKIIDKVKAIDRVSPVLVITPPIPETRLIDVVRLVTPCAGNGLAIFQHSYEGVEVLDMDVLRGMGPLQELQPDYPIRLTR